MKKYLFLLTLFSCFTMANCTKDSSIHVNKFTCKVNGVFWEAISRERDILGNDLRLDKSPVFEGGYLFANNDKKNQTISIGFSWSDTIKYSIIGGDFPFGDYSRNCNVYHLDTLFPRIVTVTEHDKVRGIVKGTFSFRAINRDAGCIDTATITNGFFDMQY
jgi:hypothetical protein